MYRFRHSQKLCDNRLRNRHRENARIASIELAGVSFRAIRSIHAKTRHSLSNFVAIFLLISLRIPPLGTGAEQAENGGV
jgi:hypothetical protein